MFTPLIPPRGDAAKNAALVGVAGSITVNTTVNTVHVHDGATPGGFALSKVGHAHAGNEVISWLGYTPIDSAKLGVANGVATLGADGYIPASQINGSVGSTSSLVGTGTFALSTTSGTYAGAGGGGAMLALVSNGGGAGNRLSTLVANAAGSIVWSLANDTNASSTPFLNVTRSGNTASLINITGTTINLNGAVNGTSFAGSGAGLTALNASNLGSGTVPTARLGSGTADGTTFLAGDGSWKTVTVTLGSTVTTSPIFNGNVNINSTVAGVQIGRNGGGSSNDAQILMTNPAAALNQKLTRFNSVVGTGINGDFVIDMVDDAYSASNAFFRVTRSGYVPNVMTLTSATINLAGLATGGLQLNGSAGTNGQVLTSNGPTAAPTWKTVTATASSLQAVSASGVTSATTGIYIGSAAGRTAFNLVQQTASADQKVWNITAPNGTSGTLQFNMLPDDLSAEVNWLSVTRSGTAASQITMTASAVNLAGLATGLKLNNSAGTTGQVLTSQGAAAAPIWSTPSTPTALNATTQVSPIVSVNSVSIGLGADTVPRMWLINGGANAAAHAAAWQTSGAGGDVSFNLYSDNLTTNAAVITINRASNVASLVTIAATAIDHTGLTGGFRMNGSAGTAGQVLTSNGSSAAPTWSTPSASVTVLNATAALGVTTVSGTTGVYAGSTGSGSTATFAMANASAAAGARLSYLQTTSTGVLQWSLAADDASAATPFFTVTRATNVASLVTIAATAIDHTGLTGGFKMNGSAGTAGQVLTSQGPSAAPTWTTIAGAGGLNTAAADVTTASSGVSIGTKDGTGVIVVRNQNATTTNRVSSIYVWNGVGNDGRISWLLADDTHTSVTSWLDVYRSANVATQIKLTGTAVNLVVGTGGLQLNGVAGNAGQVLTSNGASAAPTWQTPTAGSASLTATYIGYGNGSNALTGTASLSFTAASNTLSIGVDNTTPAVIAAGDTATGSTAASGLTVRAGNGNGANNNAGGLTLSGGNYTSTNVGPGGNATLKGGDVTGTGTGAGGNVFINGGVSSVAVGGYVSIGTSSAAAGGITERVRFLPSGAWSVGTGGAATGTAGQALVSNGSGAAPTWQTVSATVSTLSATGGLTFSTTNALNGIFIANRINSTGVPSLYFTQNTSAANERAWRFQVYDNSGVGTFALSLVNDADNAGTNALVFSRSGNNVTSLVGTIAATSFSGTLAAASLAPTSSTVPANGLYLPAANTIGFATNTTARLSISSAGVIASAAGTSVDFGGRYTELNNSLTAAATTNIDCSLGNVFSSTLGASVTSLTFSNIPASGRAFNLTLILTQDGTGSRTITWPAAVKWAAGQAPTLTTTAGKTDVITLLTVNGGTSWLAFVGGLNF